MIPSPKKMVPEVIRTNLTIPVDVSSLFFNFCSILLFIIIKCYKAIPRNIFGILNFCLKIIFTGFFISGAMKVLLYILNIYFMKLYVSIVKNYPS